ncbi:hypothetical protein B0O99DRAFT_600355 [Bisporella sp. PMI_857]|nr:hypothetical protein B0O99DRAFT_600355 [Bisporella sp. PMI_857]
MSSALINSTTAQGSPAAIRQTRVPVPNSRHPTDTETASPTSEGKMGPPAPDEASSSTSNAPTQDAGPPPASAPAPTKCSACPSTEAESKPFKPCSKCQSEAYCSRDCQKSHWKTHKKVCPERAQAWAQTANLKMGGGRRETREGHRGGEG